MRLIAFVTDQMGIGRILDHLPPRARSKVLSFPPATRNLECS